MTLLIIALIWAGAVSLVLYAHYRYQKSCEKVNDFQDNPPVMWDEIEYNPN